MSTDATRSVVVERGLLSSEEFEDLISPEAVMRLGSPDDLPSTISTSEYHSAG